MECTNTSLVHTSRIWPVSRKEPHRCKDTPYLHLPYLPANSLCLEWVCRKAHHLMFDDGVSKKALGKNPCREVEHLEGPWRDKGNGKVESADICVATGPRLEDWKINCCHHIFASRCHTMGNTTLALLSWRNQCYCSDAVKMTPRNLWSCACLPQAQWRWGILGKGIL